MPQLSPAPGTMDPITRALLQQAQPQRIDHPLQGVSQLAAALGARNRVLTAEDEQKQQEEAVRQDLGQISQALQSGNFENVQPTTIQGQQALVQILQGRKPEGLTRVDAGDRIEVYRGNELLQTIPKGATPKAPPDPVAGRDVPLPEDVFNQRAALEAEKARAQAAASANTPQGQMAATIANLQIESKRLENEKRQQEIADKKRELTENEAKTLRSEAEAEARISVVNTKVDEAISIVKDSIGASGFGAPTLSGIGGTEARRLKAALDTLQAIASFGELQKMRNNSKTGGALGAISERELVLLGSTISSLDIGLPKEDLARNLEQIRNAFGGASSTGAAQPSGVGRFQVEVISQ